MNTPSKDIFGKVTDLQKDVGSVKSDITSLRKNLNVVWGVISAVVIVFLVTFVLLMIDYWRFHGEKRQEYQQTIEKLKFERTELIIDKIVSSKIDSIQKSEALDVDLVKQIVISTIDSIN